MTPIVATHRPSPNTAFGVRLFVLSLCEVAAFRASTPFPSEGVAAPSGIEGIHWSDHWSFWEAGYPAIMITDTAPFRYPHYHAATDTSEQLDYSGFARVTGGLADVIAVLASE